MADASTRALAPLFRARAVRGIQNCAQNSPTRVFLLERPPRRSGGSTAASKKKHLFAAAAAKVSHVSFFRPFSRKQGRVACCWTGLLKEHCFSSCLFLPIHASKQREWRAHCCWKRRRLLCRGFRPVQEKKKRNSASLFLFYLLPLPLEERRFEGRKHARFFVQKAYRNCFFYVSENTREGKKKSAFGRKRGRESGEIKKQE